MAIPVIRSLPGSPLAPDTLKINPDLVERYLVRFLQDEVVRQRRINRVVLGLSGGLDSAVVATLAARALGPENVFAFLLPFRVSAASSMNDANLVVDALGIQSQVIDISAMVDGYAANEPDMTPARLGNICSRCRTVILFDQSMELGGIPLGTGNKSERLLGYFTWHGDDAPPVNPLGDLFKTQVYELARHLGVPDAILSKPPSADLVSGQTDEGDFGIEYGELDLILNALVHGYTKRHLLSLGLDERQFELVNRRLQGTHWKRRPATVAMLTDTAIGEYYLRPVDYR